jgi:hypothetical protein
LLQREPGREYITNIGLRTSPIARAFPAPAAISRQRPFYLGIRHRDFNGLTG